MRTIVRSGIRTADVGKRIGPSLFHLFRGMRKSDITITVALCGSMIAHWVLVYALTENEIRVLEKQISSGPIDRAALLRNHHPAPTDATELALAKLPRPPEIDIPRPEETMTYEDVFGEHGGKGKSFNASPGEKPMQAVHADEDQAFLNHNPNADITRSGEDTSPGSPGGGGSAGQGGGGGSPPAGSPDVAILGLTPKELANAPFGVPQTPPPSLLPPSPLGKEHPLIAVRFAEAKPPPATQRIEDHPLNATTQSVATRENSAATRPTELDPATRPADAAVALGTPSTQPAVDPTTTQPSQIALQPLKMDGPTGVLPTTQVALAQLPTTLPTTRPTHPVAVAIASIGEAVTPPEAPPTMARTPGTPGVPGSPGSPGNPGTSASSEGGNKSDSESDSFTSDNTANFLFVNGRVMAKDGRKVKTVRPHISEAGRRDLMGMENPRVDLILRIDEAGKVTDVQVIPGRSSGSDNVDLSAIRAAFEWEFEPPLDRRGKPRADIQIVPFVWR